MAITKDDIAKALDEWDCAGYQDETAWDRLIIKERWPNGIQCPRCGSKRLYKVNSGQFKCPCTYKFRITSGTLLENIKISKTSFFVFVLEVMTEKDGSTIVIRKDGTIQPKELNVFSPMEIVVNFGYKYETAFYILKKIRANIINGKLYIDGKRNQRYYKRSYLRVA
jgi:DNA-directed RNA polymerase subunit RPC12/RpoP